MLSGALYACTAGECMSAWLRCVNSKLDRVKSGFLRIPGKILNMMAYVLVMIVWLVLFFVLGVSVAALIFALMVLPSILLYIFAVIK